jgi:hypothetical protein
MCTHLLGEKVLNVVRTPVLDMPELDGQKFVQKQKVKYLGENAKPEEKQKLIDDSNKAFAIIVGSLHKKHIDLVKPIHMGNAYVLMKRLQSTFDVIQSAVSTASVITAITSHRKKPNESMNDYISHLERLFHDLSSRTLVS